MGPFSTAVLVAVLTVMRVLLWLSAALLCVLLAVQAARGEAGAPPGPTVALAAGLAIAGWICGRIARRILPPA